MPDVFHIAQIGDVSLTLHADPNVESRIRTRSKAEEALNSYRVLLPHNPAIPEVREYRIETVIYPTYQRSASHLMEGLKRLVNRVTDIIGVEILSPGHSNWMQPTAQQPNREYAHWLHNRGRITEVTPKPDNASFIELQIELETFTFWQGLNPAIWYFINRALASPATNARTTFASDEISPLPRVENWYDFRRPLSFQKKIYADTSFHYDPAYFTELSAQQDNDLPITRYTSDWFTGIKDHTIWIDPQRWSASPFSLYVVKNLVTSGAASMTIKVTHEGDIWSRQNATTTVDISAVDAAVTAAGFTLADTDILVLGDVKGHAFVLRGSTTLTYVADAVSKPASAWPGQLHPGQNDIHFDPDGATFAQHHIYRRL